VARPRLDEEVTEPAGGEENVGGDGVERHTPVEV
jgi:hypothetical protein